MWIQRTNEALLRDVAASRPAVVVTGSRQAGKTSLLERVFPQHAYVSLDVPTVAEAAERSGEQFLAQYGRPLIIDEVQYGPDLLRHVKVQIDRDRKANGQFLLTGSQKFQLMHGVTESLAGRVAVLECHSLSAQELEPLHQGVLEGEALLALMHRGGYPDVHASGISPQRFYGDYLATYLERDVRHVLQVRNLRDFDRFMRLLVLQTGQLFSANALAGTVGVSVNTIKSWLSVLEASSVIVLLEPYFRNLGKRLVKTPKLYFLDTGLACYLAGIGSGRELGQSALLGAMFETHVAGQLIRWYANRGVRPMLYFYRDHYGHEVDFVVARGEKLHLIEVKWSERPALDNPGFNELRRLIGEENLLSCSLVTSKRGQYTTQKNIIVSDSIAFPQLHAA